VAYVGLTVVGQTPAHNYGTRRHCSQECESAELNMSEAEPGSQPAAAETSTPVWPVPSPEIPGKQVVRLRKAYTAHAFRASSLGPGDPERALPGAARQGWYFFLGSAATFCVAASRCATHRPM
jgi:hypothetical protein